MIMRAEILPRYDTGPIDALLLDEAGNVRRVASEMLRLIPHQVLRVWCHQRARYLVPSGELVAWIADRIDGRHAIEICAGMGDLGRLLGIHSTDSAVQVSDPLVRQYYESLGQPAIDPPPDVERISANAALIKYRPQVVVGAWVTQLFAEGDDREPKIESSIYGVDELELLRHVETYIHVGHANVHSQKRILKHAHKTFRFPFVFSRGANRNDNLVQVWG
jgi:hypothetical protein